MDQLRDNILLDTDSYKLSHWNQYPPNTTYMFSYLESRGGKYANTVFFGLQPILKRLEKGFTPQDIEEAAAFAKTHGEPFNFDGWVSLYRKYKGKFPVKINAVPEGAVIPTHNILLSVESTDPEFFWLVSYLETLIMRIWYPITVCTQSHNIKKIIKGFLNETSDDPEGQIAFKLHDFGARGVSSFESAAIGGAAHLVNFMGSDTIAGVRFANYYYDCPMAGFSIPAAEHSTITMWGKDREVDAYRNMINTYGNGALYAVVSDSYNIYEAVDKLWGDKLRQEVLDHPGILVVRPDSGNPAQVVTKVAVALDKRFGSMYNNKGFKVLNHVRIIQGDGINEDSIREILSMLKSAGFSADNVAFGMGGALLQQVNRDTQNFAFKCSAARVDGKIIEVSKSPVDQSMKASKPGVLTLVQRHGRFETVKGYNDTLGSVMRTVFENGNILVNEKFDDVRKRANQ